MSEVTKKVTKKDRRRMYVALLFWILVAIIAIMVASTLFGKYGLTIGLALGILNFGLSVKYFLISVPEVTGLLTINLFGGKLFPYGPGLHFKYPWEIVKEKNYFSLEAVTVKREEFATFVSRDGVPLLVDWTFQYRPDEEKLDTFIGFNRGEIEKGFADLLSGNISAAIAEQDAIPARANIQVIRDELQKPFEDTAAVGSPGIKLEEKYGVQVVNTAIADIAFTEDFQKARTTERVAERLNMVAESLQKKSDGTKKDIKDKDALNTALIINKNVTKHIQEVEGEGGQALAALIMAAARGGK